MKKTLHINIYQWETAAQAWEIMELFQDRINELQATMKTVVELAGKPGLSTPDEIRKFLREQIEYPEVKRPCVVCGESQFRKKVWSKFGTGKHQKVICLTCGIAWEFGINGDLRRYHSRSTNAELLNAVWER